MYTIYFMLYLIEILHQTTTPFEGFCPLSELYLIEILHQTTTGLLLYKCSYSCILSKFYIKPQRGEASLNRRTVVSYRNSTSNHNSIDERAYRLKLYLIEILHQTTTYSMETFEW